MTVSQFLKPTMLVGVGDMDRGPDQFWVNPVQMEGVVGVVRMRVISRRGRDSATRQKVCL